MNTRLDAAVTDDTGSGGPIHLPGELGGEPTRLPGETASDISADASTQIDGGAPAPHKNRRLWLVGGSVAAVALVAGGAVALSPLSPFAPKGTVGQTRERARAAFAGVSAPAPIAPASKLAAVAVPEKPEAPIKTPPVVLSRDGEIAEFRGLKTDTASVPGAAPSAGVEAVAEETGVTAPSPPHAAATPSGAAEPVKAPPHRAAGAEAGVAAESAPLPIAIAREAVVRAPAAESGGPAEQAINLPVHSAPPGERAPAADLSASSRGKSVAGTTSAETPPPPAASRAPVTSDAAGEAAALQPAPMTDAQQLQVLGLVTQLGVLMRDLKTEVAAVHEDQQRLGAATAATLADFDRRLSLAEAKWAMSVAMLDAGGSLAKAAAPRSGGEGRGQGSSEPATPAPSAAAHHYRVQAASPGLAMLSEVTPAGVHHVQVAVGDAVPGYGRITKIAQKGTAWVVVTEKGAIQ
jgi:hypothetical protein